MARVENRLLHIAPEFAGLAGDLETMEAQFAANADVLHAKRNVLKKDATWRTHASGEGL